MTTNNQTNVDEKPEGDEIDEVKETEGAEGAKVENEPEGDNADDTEARNALGDKGKQALDRMRERARTAERTARENAAKVAALEAKLSGDEGAHAAKTEAENAALAKANDRLRRAEVRSAAKGRLANPADALVFLDLEGIDVGDDGEIDSDEIEALIENLLAERPYLGTGAGQAVKPARFNGSGDNGARRVEAPRQWTQADLDKASPAEVLKAHKEGLLKKLQGI